MTKRFHFLKHFIGLLWCHLGFDWGTNLRTRIHTYTGTCTRASLRTCARTSTGKHAHAYSHTCTRAHRGTKIHIHTKGHPHTHTHKQTHKWTHKPTYTCTLLYTLFYLPQTSSQSESPWPQFKLSHSENVLPCFWPTKSSIFHLAPVFEWSYMWALQ